MPQRLRHHLRVAAVALATAGLPAMPGTSLAQDNQAGAAAMGQPDRVMWGVIDLDFAGGTAASYLDAVRQAAGGKINIVAMPHVEEIIVPAMKLRKVSVFAAISLLDGESLQAADRLVRLGVQPVGLTGGDVTPLFKVTAVVNEMREYSGLVRSNIWSVADMISGGMTPDNITTAVSAALELIGPESARAKVRFHKETSLLLARAEVEQIEIIGNVIDELRRSNAQKQAQSMAPIRQQAEEMKTRLVETQAKMEAMNGEMIDRLRAAETAKARAEAMERRAAELERMSSGLRDEVTGRESLVRELQVRIAELETQLQQLKAQRGKDGG